ncbi:hypothetical protein MKW94_002736 [Papaver nudicaule]|uniref:Uncharacterized protein n=1 Tax=Papaver nudicaule TaxID=74823 RepID=A0AA41S9Z9_PAPNU|nr:hypothetical protein [Papaver nudicaule]
MIFILASRYVSRPVSCISILHAIPSISKRHLITSIYALPLLIGAYLANFAYLCLIHAIPKLNVIAIIFAIIYGFFITGVDVYIMALWNLANVISVLEPNVHGLSAMKKSKQLLPGRTSIAMIFVDVYLLAALVILLMANLVMTMNIHIIVRILLIAFCVIIMAGVNFVGLIGQSVLYYACKSCHNQAIDRKVLNEHLCGKKFASSNSVEGDKVEV